MKSIAKIISVLLIILPLMQSSTATAEAITGIPVEAIQGTTVEVTQETTSEEILKTTPETTPDTDTTEGKDSTGGTADEMIVMIPRVITHQEDIFKNAENYQLTFKENEKEKIFPVDISKKGGLFVTLGQTDLNYNALEATIYKDEACSNKIENSVDLINRDGLMERGIRISKRGKYYIKFELQKKNETDVVTFNVDLSIISNESKTLNNGESYLAYQDSESPAIIYKVVAKSTGVIAISMARDMDNKIKAKTQLLNKDKKALSRESYAISKKNSDGKPLVAAKFYTVTKGTYYIKVNVSCGIYAINYEFCKTKEEAGASKKKAATLKVGGAPLSGRCLNSDKTTKVEWFKFTRKSNKSNTISIVSLVEGKLNFEVIDPKGRTILFTVNTIDEGHNLMNLHLQKEWPKGTYYIKIYKKDKQSSGYFTMSVK